mmetsp:Transcript_88219/g.224600  ORF Transcript_88219/g.224600 Transcript_88219/m.224600 type:complete len:292 (-) Transcript_88219:81-956(-)
MSGPAKGKGDLDTVVLKHASGATAEIYLWGATLTSYKTPDGTERIFCSPAAIFDGKKAVRGGIPLVFPQFGQPDKAMAQHGVARISTWTVAKVEDSSEASVAMFTLSDNLETLVKWNHAFQLEYTVVLTAMSLKVTLKVINSGHSPFSFNFLLHTYLQIPDISSATVCGLNGRTYVDKVAGGDPKLESSLEVTLPSYTDRVYVGDVPMPKDIVVKGVGGVPLFALINEASVGVETKAVDMVIWNPYEEASPGDLPPPAFKEFVCVEPGLVNAFAGLPPSGTAEISQKIIPL